jgi:hypothetical protein
VSVDLPADYVFENVDLGYAMTAHRAQGRTVDVAHAYVTATTTREPLYVMATRGREANRLYVDTTYDPDRATAHDNLPAADPREVLRGVLAHTPADASATQTRADEYATDSGPARVAAEGTALQALSRERRYTTALLAAGYASHDIEAAKKADHWRPLIERMTAAEHAGLDPSSAAALDWSRGSPAVADLTQRLEHWVGRALGDMLGTSARSSLSPQPPRRVDTSIAGAGRPSRMPMDNRRRDRHKPVKNGLGLP